MIAICLATGLETKSVRSQEQKDKRLGQHVMIAEAMNTEYVMPPEKEKPFFLVIAFPCGPWSPSLHLNKNTDIAKLQEDGAALMRWNL